MRYARNKVLFTEPLVEPIVESIPLIENSDTKEKETKLQNIINQNNFRQEKYLELVKQFIDTHCEYEYMNMISHQSMREKWNEFIRDNYDKIKHLNIAWGITASDIPKLDDRFAYKRVHICKSCSKKQYAKCCNDYEINNRRSTYFMIHMKLK